MQNDDLYSTVKITPELISRIVDSLKNKAYGSIEIYVENFSVTQITERTINKFNKTASNPKRQKAFQAGQVAND